MLGVQAGIERAGAGIAGAGLGAFGVEVPDHVARLAGMLAALAVWAAFALSEPRRGASSLVAKARLLGGLAALAALTRPLAGSLLGCSGSWPCGLLAAAGLAGGLALLGLRSDLPYDLERPLLGEEAARTRSASRRRPGPRLLTSAPPPARRAEEGRPCASSTSATSLSSRTSTTARPRSSTGS
jgi:hypothetical protein